MRVPAPVYDEETEGDASERNSKGPVRGTDWWASSSSTARASSSRPTTWTSVLHWIFPRSCNPPFAGSRARRGRSRAAADRAASAVPPVPRLQEAGIVMRFVKVAVESFQAIQRADVEFGPGLNVVYGPNDLGKSTLARHQFRAALLVPPTSSKLSLVRLLLLLHG